jgi:hypothetical protein
VKYWIDTEFIARPCTIDLISIGLVAEDGREFYAESSEVDWSKASLWTLENVRPQLDGKGMRRVEIGYALRHFTNGDEHPVFWGRSRRRRAASHRSQEPVSSPPLTDDGGAWPPWRNQTSASQLVALPAGASASVTQIARVYS